MTTKHALRLAFALTAALAAAACSKVEDPALASAHPGPSSGEHGSESSSGLPAGRLAEGEKLAHAKGKATGQSCVDCHGEAGNSPIDATYPKLGGQYGDYIAHALQQYRAGDRQHPLMTAQAAQLSDQDISDLAAYFGSQPAQLRDLHGL
jgi:cytochrome c553